MFGSTAKAISHYKDKQILLNSAIRLLIIWGTSRMSKPNNPKIFSNFVV